MLDGCYTGQPFLSRTLLKITRCERNQSLADAINGRANTSSPEKCCLGNVRKIRSNVERIVVKAISFLSSVAASVTGPATYIGRC